MKQREYILTDVAPKLAPEPVAAPGFRYKKQPTKVNWDCQI